ncbi:MAG TPA: choice-of-anchor D domain-containing protein, partial [Candidatus Kapabacteria bacterium]
RWYSTILGVIVLALFCLSSNSSFAQLSANYTFESGTGSKESVSGTNVFGNDQPGARYLGNYSSGTPQPWDFESSVISAPFPITFNCNTYNEFRIYMSGMISLGSGTIYSSSYNDIGNVEMPVIAAYWDNLHITGSGQSYRCGWQSHVSYGVTGSAPNRILVIDWSDMEINEWEYYGSYYDIGNRGTFQIQMHENGKIVFYYDKMEVYPTCGSKVNYPSYGMYPTISGSIGIAENAKDFLSVTPTGNSGYVTDYANNSIDLNSQPIYGNTSFVWLPPNVQMSATPKIVDFGTIGLGASVMAAVTVKHAGDACVLNILGTSITGPGSSHFSVLSAPSSLSPGQTGTILVRFAPTLNGSYDVFLNVTSNGRDSGVQQILLSGKAVAPIVQVLPIGTVNTATKMFRKTRTLVGDSTRESFLVKNIGDATLVISAASGFTGDNPGMYKVTRKPASAIGPGQADTVTITFSPSIEGSVPARYNLVTNAFNGTQIIDLLGVGIIPRIELTPGEMVTFDSIPIGTTVCKNVRISNNGSDTLRLTHNYLSSSDGDFSYTPLVGKDTVIVPNSFRDVQVCITPLQKGTRRARLRFTTNIPFTFPTNGPRQDTTAKSVEIWANAVPADHTIIAMGEFSDAVIGTEVSAPATLTNTGSETITVEEPFFSGTNAKEFKATKANFPLQLTPGASISFTVVSTPKVRGENLAVMNIANKSEDRQYLQAVNLSVKGLAASSALNESALNFDKLYLGEESSKTVIVENTGDVDQVYTATLVGAGYTLTSNSLSGAVSPGSSAVYTVKFAPNVKGVSSGTLTFTSTHIADMAVALSGDADEKPVTQSLKGDIAMKGFVLSQNAPNPATGKTSFSFTTPSTVSVRIILADITGKTVRELANGVYGTGEHVINMLTNDISSGSYVYILESEGVRLVRQMIINK